MKKTSVRVPLQTGETSLASFARGLSMFLVSSAMCTVGWGWLFTDRIDPISSNVILTTALFVFFFSLRHFTNARRWRASDIVFSPDGIRIEGGKFDGRAFAWSDIRPARCEILNVSEDMRWRGKTELAHLLLGLGELDSEELAAAQTPAERQSIASVLAMLKSPRWNASAAAAPPRPADPTVLVCPGCGAPAVPTDAATTPCAYCGVTVPVPEDLRVRIRAASDLSALEERTARQLRRALAQSVARPVNLLFVAAVAVAAVFGTIAVLRARVDAAVVEIGALGVIVALLVHAIAGRRAFAAVLRLGAIEPARPGDPYACRRCLAPLPEGAGRLVVACAYCRAQNVLGLDVRRDVQEISAEETDLAGALAARPGRNLRVLALLLLPAILSVVLVKTRADNERAYAKRAVNYQDILASSMAEMMPTGHDLAARWKVAVPVSSWTGHQSQIDLPIIVGPQLLVHGDAGVPGNDAAQVGVLVGRDDAAAHVTLGVRIVADGTTPVARLRAIIAGLGKRDVAIATVGAAGEDHALDVPDAGQRMIRLESGRASFPDADGGRHDCKGVTAEVLIACSREAQLAVGIVPAPTATLQDAFRERDALATTGLVVTLVLR